MALSVAKKARDASTKGYRTSSDRRSGKNEHGNNKEPRVEAEDRATKEGPLCYGNR